MVVIVLLISFCRFFLVEFCICFLDFNILWIFWLIVLFNVCVVFFVWEVWVIVFFVILGFRFFMVFFKNWLLCFMFKFKVIFLFFFFRVLIDLFYKIFYCFVVLKEILLEIIDINILEYIFCCGFYLFYILIWNICIVLLIVVYFFYWLYLKNWWRKDYF